MEYKQTFQSPSARMTQPARMTPVGQARPGRVSGKELEIADCELSKAIASNFGFGFDPGIPV